MRSAGYIPLSSLQLMAAGWLPLYYDYLSFTETQESWDEIVNVPKKIDGFTTEIEFFPGTIGLMTKCSHSVIPRPVGCEAVWCGATTRHWHGTHMDDIDVRFIITCRPRHGRRRRQSHPQKKSHVRGGVTNLYTMASSRQAGRWLWSFFRIDSDRWLEGGGSLGIKKWARIAFAKQWRHSVTSSRRCGVSYLPCLKINHTIK